MKHLLLVILFLGLSVSSFAQLYRYTYDAAGNRTVRKYSLTIISLENEDDENQDTNSRMLKNYEVTIMEGYIDGEILVRISNMDNQTKASFAIYTISGTKVLQSDIKNEITMVDLTSQTSGIYMLRVFVEGKTYNWKVVKEI